MKFAFISENLPPSTRSPGQAGMLYRLLAPLDPAEYCLVSRVDYGAEQHMHAANRLPATYHRLSSGALQAPDDQGPPTEPSGARALPRRLADVLRRARGIAAILKRERCSAAVACPDRVGDLPTAFLASRLARAHFVAYFFDYYSAWFNRGPSGLVARRLEPFILKRAAVVIVPNEGLRDTLERRYGVKAAVIHNACDLSVYEGPAGATEPLTGRTLDVVFTGAVYDAHYDGFRALLDAFDRETQPARLHLYTPMARAQLGDRGLDERIVYHGYVGATEIPAVQQAADVLFLPLAFHSPFPEVIRTSAPAKMAEYLAAARPILVHAPPESFVAQYFRHHDCGLVVSTQDPAAVAQALGRLRDDAALRERLSLNAWRRAHADYDLDKARAEFAALFGISPPDAS